MLELERKIKERVLTLLELGRKSKRRVLTFLVGILRGGRYRDINTGTVIKTETLKKQLFPGVIQLDLPDGAPISISSTSLGVNNPDKSGKYQIDLLPNTVSSVLSRRPGIVDGKITKNELELLPSAHIITKAVSETPSLLTITPTSDIASGGTMLAMSLNKNTVTAAVSTDSTLLDASIANNTLKLSPTPLTVTSNSSAVSGTVKGNQLQISVGTNVVTAAKVTPNSSALSATVANNTLTLSSPYIVNALATSGGVTASFSNQNSSTNTCTLNIGLNAVIPVFGRGSFSVDISNQGSGEFTYWNGSIQPSSGVFIFPQFAAASADNWGSGIIATIKQIRSGSVTGMWVTRSGGQTGTIVFHVLIIN